MDWIILGASVCICFCCKCWPNVNFMVMRLYKILKFKRKFSGETLALHCGPVRFLAVRHEHSILHDLNKAAHARQARNPLPNDPIAGFANNWVKCWRLNSWLCPLFREGKIPLDSTKF